MLFTVALIIAVLVFFRPARKVFVLLLDVLFDAAGAPSAELKAGNHYDNMSDENHAYKQNGYHGKANIEYC